MGTSYVQRQSMLLQGAAPYGDRSALEATSFSPLEAALLSQVETLRADNTGLQAKLQQEELKATSASQRIEELSRTSQASQASQVEKSQKSSQVVEAVRVAEADAAEAMRLLKSEQVRTQDAQKALAEMRQGKEEAEAKLRKAESLAQAEASELQAKASELQEIRVAAATAMGRAREREARARAVQAAAARQAEHLTSEMRAVETRMAGAVRTLGQVLGPDAVQQQGSEPEDVLPAGEPAAGS